MYEGRTWFDRLTNRTMGLGCLTWLILCPITICVIGFFTCRFVNVQLQKPIIRRVYGPAAYDLGVRVVHGDGRLSDGNKLPETWNLFLAVGTYLGTLPVLLPYVLLLIRFGLFNSDTSRRRS